jgi:hypothetical protein
MLLRKSQLRRIALLIIGALFLVVMISFMVNNVLKAAETSAWKTECKTSIETFVRSRSIGEAVSWFFSSQLAEDIRCPTLDIHIDENLDSKQGQNAAIKKIKQLTIDCWDIYGQGRLKLFSDETTYCAVCAIFDFKEKDKEIRLFGKEFDYAGTINSNDIYAVIFIYPKGEQEIEEFNRMLNRETASGKIAAYIGPYISNEWYAASLFGEYTREGLAGIGCDSMPIEQ